MKRNKLDRIYLGVSISGFALMSVSFLLMPIETMRILPGLLFWLGLAVGVAFQIVLEARRRSFFTRYKASRKKMQKPKNGLLTFASNKAAAIVDKFFIVSTVVMVLVLIQTKGVGYLCYICISITLLTFCLHCILNGRNYFHANNQDRVRQVLEQKKVKSIERGEEENE